MSDVSPVNWETKTKEQFETILQQIPDMVRGIAEARINKKALSLVSKDGRTSVEQKDMVDAFFAETPSAFVAQMKAGMEKLGIDYKQYGHS